jgi:hypothetical protein
MTAVSKLKLLVVLAKNLHERRMGSPTMNANDAAA